MSTIISENIFFSNAQRRVERRWHKAGKGQEGAQAAERAIREEIAKFNQAAEQTPLGLPLRGNFRSAAVKICSEYNYLRHQTTKRAVEYYPPSSRK